MTADVEHAERHHHDNELCEPLLLSSGGPLSDDTISHCADRLRSTMRGEVEVEDDEEDVDSPLYIILTVDSTEATTAAAAAAAAADASNQQHNNSSSTIRASPWVGPLLLLLVAFLFATLNICLRRLYLMPDPLSPSALSMTRGWLIMGFFLPVLLGHSKLGQRRRQRRRQQRRPSLTARTEQRLLLPHQRLPEPPNPSLWRAAAELAIFNFFGQALYNLGIASVSSARASFLGQTTVVLVPLLSSLTGEAALQMWDGMGCLSSLVGLILLSVQKGAAGSGGGGGDASGDAATTTPSMTSDSYYYNDSYTNNNNDYNDGDHPHHSAAPLHLGMGDVLILCSAVCWSFYLIGTSKYAHAYDTIYLQGAKNALLAVMYTLWWLTAMVHMGTTHEQEGTAVDSWQKDAWYNTIGSSITNRPTVTTWVILVYSALGPGIVADLIQQKGQALTTTGATGSNLILCMESLFTAVLGRLLLGEETSWIEKLGGICLVLGAWISGRQDDAAG